LLLFDGHESIMPVPINSALLCFVTVVCNCALYLRITCRLVITYLFEYVILSLR